MTTRSCTPQRINALKTAFKRVVADLGGIDAAATVSRVGRTLISDYGNIESDRMPPGDVAFDFEYLTGQPHYGTAYMSLLGYDVAKRETRPAHVLAELLSRISLDNGKLLAQAAHVLGHKKISPKERRAMINELADMVDAARETLILLEQNDADETDAV